MRLGDVDGAVVGQGVAAADKDALPDKYVTVTWLTVTDRRLHG